MAAVTRRDAERSVVAGLLVEPGRFPEASHLSAGSFSDSQLAELFAVVAGLQREGVPVDLATIRVALERRGTLDACGGMLYVSELLDSTPRSMDIGFYANQVAQNAAARDVERHLTLTAAEIREHGATAELLEPLAAALRQLVETPRRAPLQFQSAAAIMATPAPEAVVEGVSYVGCVSSLTGGSGTGKTFVVTSVSSAVISGASWFGRRTKRGSVAYCSFEGDALGPRCEAVRAQGRSLEGLYFLRASTPLSPRQARDGTETPSIGELDLTTALESLQLDLQARGEPPVRLLVIDTVRAALAGSEDDSDNTAAFLRAVRRIARRTPDAGVILNHHTGWLDGDQARRRERGSSAWRGNVDWALYLEASEPDSSGSTPIVLSTLKARDAERAAPLALIRKVVTLDSVDAYGRHRTSCVIEADPRSHQDRQAEEAAAVAAEARVVDLRTLRTIRDRPDAATSQDGLRMALGIRKVDVAESLRRLLQLGWVSPGARRQPYQLTQAGRDALEADS